MVIITSCCFAVSADCGEAKTASAPNVSTSINDFGFRLLRDISQDQNANLIISPFSVFVALAMTYNGAAGSTKSAMAAVLDVSSFAHGALNAANRDLLQTIRDADPAVRTEAADALWVQSGFAILPAFIEVNRDFYDATVESLDFKGRSAEATQTINNWVKDKTHGKIPAILDKPDPRAKLILTNAVYFKAKWSQPFDPSKTHPHDFHLADGTTIKASMMSQERTFLYSEDAEFQGIQLPYSNGRFAMYVFLPRQSDRLATFIERLNGASWKQMTARLLRGMAI